MAAEAPCWGLRYGPAPNFRLRDSALAWQSQLGLSVCCPCARWPLSGKRHMAEAFEDKTAAAARENLGNKSGSRGGNQDTRPRGRMAKGHCWTTVALRRHRLGMHDDSLRLREAFIVAWPGSVTACNSIWFNDATASQFEIASQPRSLWRKIVKGRLWTLSSRVRDPRLRLLGEKQMGGRPGLNRAIDMSCISSRVRSRGIPRSM